jgi:hypothetical protein
VFNISLIIFSLYSTVGLVIIYPPGIVYLINKGSIGLFF